MRRFFTTTDAELALASSWRKTTTRDKLSECRRDPEVEIPRPEAGEEMDVGESVVDLPQPVPQPVPTVRVGGSSSSGTKLDQVQKQMKRTQMIVR